MINLRRAPIYDALLFYALRRDLETHRFLPRFGEALSLENHMAWFAARVWTAAWYVAEQGGQSVGVVRLDGEPDRSVSIIVAPNVRGRGIGLEMLRQLAAIECGPFYASIHQLNAPSIRVFERAGYVRVGSNGVWLLYRRD